MHGVCKWLKVCEECEEWTEGHRSDPSNWEVLITAAQ